jgi:hypothetical protein
MLPGALWRVKAVRSQPTGAAAIQAGLDCAAADGTDRRTCTALRKYQKDGSEEVPERLSLARVYMTFSPSTRASPVVNRTQSFLCAM